jgi:hypothetical protein
MANRHTLSALSFLVASLAAGGAYAQTPAALPQQDISTTAHWQLLASVAVDGQGTATLLWSQYYLTGDLSEVARGRRFSASDAPLGSDIVFDKAASLPAAVVANKRGDYIVIWNRVLASGAVQGVLRRNRRLFGQRFGFTTGRQGSELQVTPRSFDAGHRVVVDVGRAEDGSFVVAWSSHLQFEEPVTHIFAQRFTDAGAKRGGEIVIADDTPITDGYVRLAVAPQGQFAAAWDDGGPPLFIRLYRKDGTPAGPARQLQQSATLPFPGTPEAEVDHVFAIRGGTPLLGDVDGDGRDDYCLFRNTRFDCDSGHDYGKAEFTALFGQPGDKPLLGDLDGDGRDEVCVFRAGRFLCDTAHDGGAAELEILFGQPGDRALLGDVDGDGRDDLCTAHDEEFRCDTARDGGAAETVLLFMLGPGMEPLLADSDNDGREDPCHYGNGVFLCDDDRDGGSYTFYLFIENSPGRPLIGNVDGV